jgi:hypothetical protein
MMKQTISWLAFLAFFVMVAAQKPVASASRTIRTYSGSSTLAADVFSTPTVVGDLVVVVPATR